MRFDDIWTACRSAPATQAAIVGVTAAAILAAPLASVAPAAAQTVCMQRDQAVAMLDKRFAEAPVARGLAQGGRLVEVFSSADGETWTLMLTAPDGTTCVMAEGQGWFALPGPVAGQVS